MCGIAGLVGDFEDRLVDAMSAAIAHRGPDDAGTWRDAARNIWLAHRRLSIIDLSPAGHQPMWDAERRAVIVFNGEIYNYRALREELVASGFRFRGNSDTEVLLNLYLRDGASMLGRLNGIFAFAIWDPRDGSLLLARDALGVKPLYYAQTAKGFLFASEIKALLVDDAIPRMLDPAAVVSYLTYLWCPAPATMLDAVKKLEPGHAMRVRAGRIEERWAFYQLPFGEPARPAMDVGEAIGEVRRLVRQAVERQMVADVPVGAFLSGGLDSSAIVAFARAFTGGRRLQCFTIAFEGGGAVVEGMTEDLPYARRVATHLDVDLHTIAVGPQVVDRLEPMIWHLDEPQADPAPLNVLLISELARAHGIKALLSGAGGDDLFSGYRRHYAVMQERYWAWVPRPARAALRRLAQSLPADAPLGRRLAKAFRYADLDGDERIDGYFRWLPPERVRALCKPLLAGAANADAAMPTLASSLAALPAGTPPLDRMLYLECRHFLADHNLNYTDKASMAAGVEVRVPLLDPDLVRFAAALPVAYKQRGGAGKWIFRKAMEPFLPRDVIARPKTGFGAPLRHWLRGPLAPAVADVLAPRSLARRGLFDPAEVARLVDADRTGRVDAAYTIFAMMCVELWCRRFVDRAVPASRNDNAHSGARRRMPPDIATAAARAGGSDG